MEDVRLNHSLGVANKMVEIGKAYELACEELADLYLLGRLHDIGYVFDPTNHNVVGGNILKSNNYKYWKEVYYHGIPTSSYRSLYLDILNAADMMIDIYGNDVGFDKRLEDIGFRYGCDSAEYLNSKAIIDEIKSDKDFPELYKKMVRKNTEG